MPNTESLKLFGPPGTGKTHSGVAWIERQIDEGCDPYNIAFVSLTNAACDEARERVAAKLDIYPDDLPYCATLHALCKRRLGIQGNEWLANRKLKEFGAEFDYDLIPTKRGDTEDWDSLTDTGGQDAPLKAIWDFGRSRKISDADGTFSAFDDYDPEGAMRVDYSKYLAFVEDYERWKRRDGLRDFTDLLIEAVERQVTVPASAVAVDEAQDQSPLLWEVYDTLFRDTPVRAVLADPDQAIYGFQGAEPALFTAREADERILLGQSRRLSRRVCELALKIIRQNSDRTDIPLQPATTGIIEARRDRESGPARQDELEGEVRRAWNLGQLDLLNGESWMILMRNWKFSSDIMTHLESAGVPYRIGGSRYYSPWDDKGPLRAVKAIHTLARNEAIGMTDLAILLDKTRADAKGNPGVWKFGSKTKLENLAVAEPLDRLTLRDLHGLGLTDYGLACIVQHDLKMLEPAVKPRDLDAYRNAERKGTFGQEARVIVNTGHGAKGTEADNVAAINGCTPAPSRSLDDPKRRAEEVRIAYVMASRARKQFFEVEREDGLPWELFGIG